MKMITGILFIAALLIITGECFMVAFVVIHKTDRIINTLTELIANLQVSALMPGNNRQTLPASTKEVKDGEAVENADKKKSNVITRENNLQSAEYSGVLHKFARDGMKHERPIMVFTYQGKKVFFEYDEAGEPIYLRAKTRSNVLETLEGKKVRNFKLYEIEKK